MALTPRRKALAWALGLLTVSTLFLATAVATTDDAIRPLLRGDDYPHERSLTRNGVALAVRVGAAGDDGEDRGGPIEGATVKVFRVTREDQRGELVKEDTTNEKGVALFQLRPGAYRVAVVAGDHESSSTAFRLQHDSRVGVAFDGDGNAHWFGPVNHRDLERRGDPATIFVRVAYNESGNRTPAEGATVSIYHDGEFVVSNTTGPRGWAVFQVRAGAYDVTATYGDAEGTKTIAVRHQATVAFYFDGDEVVSRAAQGAPGGSPRGR